MGAHVHIGIDVGRARETPALQRAVKLAFPHHRRRRPFELIRWDA
jgi:hypothetical protein